MKRKDIDIRHEPFTIYQLNRKINQGKLYYSEESFLMDSGMWNLQEKSLFVESIIYGFPIPPFLAKKNKIGGLEIEDGRKRFLAIQEFSENKLKLSGLKIIEELNGCCYRDLGLYQTSFEDRKVDFFVLPYKTEERIISELWKRLNANRLEK